MTSKNQQMEIDFYVMNPAGNITILVQTNVARELYGKVSAALMSLEAFAAEQVGFLVPPKLGANVRLEMMGGEFCGNALRSAGYLHALESGVEADGVVHAEISGSALPLEVRVDTTAATAWTDMPLPLSIEPCRLGGQPATLVRFAGIVHVVLEQAQPEEALVREAVAFSQQKYDADAVGVMFLDLNTRFLRPVVYVRGTQSLIYESSCASGSAAVAVALSAREGDGEFTYELRQPGGVLSATVKRKQGQTSALSIGGEIHLSGHYRHKINIPSA